MAIIWPSVEPIANVSNEQKVIVKNSNVNDRFGGSGASHCVAQSNLVCYDSYDSCKLFLVITIITDIVINKISNINHLEI